MATLFHDLRFAARTLTRSPGFTAGAALVLALGIGASTAVFSLVDAVLFRPLPAERPRELVRAFGTDASGQPAMGTSYPRYLEYCDQARSFAGLAAWSEVATLDLATGAGRAERVAGAVVSGGYFAVLGVRPARGRLLGPEDDRTPGGHPVAVISDRLWRRRFGADPRTVGAVVRLNGHPFTVVGVALPGFLGLGLDRLPDVWLPLAMTGQALPAYAPLRPLESRGFAWLEVVGRLAPGASVAAAQAELAAIAVTAEQAAGRPQGARRGIVLLPAGEAALELGGRGRAVELSWLLLGVVALVLAIACADGAGLLLVRGERRQREMAIRLAIGGSRRRIVRQLLLESLLLSGLAAAAGLVLAAWLTDLLATAAPDDFPLPFDAASPLSHPRVLTFTMATAVLTGVLFGLLPALRASRPDLLPVLKSETAARTVGGRRVKLSDAFVVLQVALSTVLLAGAGLLLQTLWNASRVDPGFSPERALVASLELARQGYDEASGLAFGERLLERVAAVPGVESVALAHRVPVTRRGMQLSVEINGQVEPSGDPPVVDFSPVSPGYFATMGMPLLRGRSFTAADRAAAPPVAIVNQAMAERFWPGRDPIGQRIGGFDRPLEVVGVVRDARVHSLREPPLPMLHVPLAQFYVPWTTLVVRTAADPLAFLPRVEAAVAELDPDLPLGDVRTLEQQLGSALAQERILAGLLAACALVALALAASGLYGVISYAAEIRSREFGIRLSLGATPGHVLGLVLRQSTLLAGAGLCLGLAASLAAGRLLAGLLFEVSPTDPVALGVAALLLALAAALAGQWPARRATRVDPVVALRSDV